MSKWKEFRIGDVVEIRHGYAFKGEYFTTDPTSDILLTPGNFHIGGGFKSNKFKYYQGEVPPSYVLAEGDVIVTMTDLSKEGDTLGYAAKIPKQNGVRFLHNQRLGKLIPKSNEVALDFLYWLMRTRRYQSFILGSASGTTVKHTSPAKISEYRFKAPDLPTQNAIAEILSSLDDKIELNNQINQNLEALAQAIFKRWFVDFEFPDENGQPYKSSGGEMVESELGEIPKGWSVGPLDSITDLIVDYRGKTPKKLGMDWSTQGIPALSAKNVKGRRIYNLRDVYYGSEELHKIWMKDPLQAGDIVLTSEAPLGETALLLKRHHFILSQRLFALRAKKDFRLYLFEWLSSAIGQAELHRRASGSTVLGIRQSELRQIKLLLPDKRIATQHTTLLYSLYELIDENELENEYLTDLRDTLLPKLISGELEIETAKKSVAMAI